jgi:hypothetical protein
MANKVSKKITWTLVAIGLGIVVFWLIAYLIVFPIVFPDIEDTGRTSSLFVEVSSETGYHPEPSLFFIVCFPVLGTIIGSLIAYKLVWKKKVPKAKTTFSN